jgi:hypothetical protein
VIDDAAADRLLTAIREDARTFTGPTPKWRYSRKVRREKRIRLLSQGIAEVMRIRASARRRGNLNAVRICETTLRWHVQQLDRTARGKR